jgi:heptose I phosphotransferase
MLELEKFTSQGFDIHGDVVYAREHRALLQNAGLCDFDSFFSNPAAEKIKHVRDERATFRLKAASERKSVELFIKRAVYNPFWTRIKNIIKLKRESPSALYELENLLAFRTAGFPVAEPAAAGFRRRGASAESFLATLALPAGARLSDYAAAHWRANLAGDALIKKRAVIRDLAALARRMHASGFCHRDFYLVHFLLDENTLKLYLLDLNRALRWEDTPMRWKIKDLAALDFSAPEGAFSVADRVRFLKAYLGSERLGPVELKFARAITAKSLKTARHAKKARTRDKRYVEEKGGILP